MLFTWRISKSEEEGGIIGRLEYQSYGALRQVRRYPGILFCLSDAPNAHPPSAIHPIATPLLCSSVYVYIATIYITVIPGQPMTINVNSGMLYRNQQLQLHTHILVVYVYAYES